MPMLTILDPTGKPRPGREPIPGPVATLRAKVVAILNNRWKSMDLVAERFEAALRRDHGVADVLQRVIPISAPAPPALLDEVAARAAVAVVGLAN
jgi:hypothetical protein